MIGIGAGQQSPRRLHEARRREGRRLAPRPTPEGAGPRASSPGVKRQQRINWRVRYIEGDLTASEEAALRDVLDEPLVLLTEDERRAWIARLDGVSLVSDGFIPFRDNIDHAREHGVKFIAQPGGSTRDDEIEAACREYGIAMVHTQLRLFHH